MPVVPALEGSTFDADLRSRHLVYYYDVTDTSVTASGKPEKWKYEIWFYNEDRIVYHIHGGPMAGRINFQAATYQCIRPGELWQCNWLEETGTICSLVFDMKSMKIFTLIAFSKGHWENPEDAHGNKRDPAALERWRKLAHIGIQTDRKLLVEHADMAEDFRGQGDLEEIDMAWPCL